MTKGKNTRPRPKKPDKNNRKIFEIEDHIKLLESQRGNNEVLIDELITFWKNRLQIMSPKNEI